MTNDLLMVGNRARAAKVYYHKLVRQGASPDRIEKARRRYEKNEMEYRLLKTNKLWERTHNVIS